MDKTNLNFLKMLEPKKYEKKKKKIPLNKLFTMPRSAKPAKAKAKAKKKGY